MIKNCYVLIVVLATTTLVLLPQGVFSQEEPTYVGTATCNNCHGDESNFAGNQWRTWRNTKHNMKWRDPDEGLGVVTHDDFVNGLDLSTTAAFASFGANAPVLGFDATDPGDSTDGKSGYRVTIDTTTYEVNWTLGGTGDWKQRYMTKIGNSIYILPIQYNEKTGQWVTYHTGTWYDGTTPKAAPPLADSYERRCIGCHSVNPEVAFDAGTGEWTATITERNIGCEACHGPGSLHATTTDTTKIINPDEDLVDRDRRLEVCGSCHGRGASTATLGGETLGYPYSDTSGHYKPGEVLADYYTQTTSSSNFWPNVEPYGRNSKSHHQQYNDFLTSKHYTTPFEEIACWTCHEPHGNTPHKHLIRDKIVEDGLVITTDNDDNTLCLACHATFEPFAGITKEMVADPTGTNLDTIKAVVTKHTNHFYDPTGTGSSRCSKCHNPKVAKSAVEYDIHAHTFWVISPAQTLDHQAEGGMPNSCAVSCHVKPEFPNLGVDVSGDVFKTWNEQTDIDLAEELLFWHDNMWFKELGGEGKTVTAPEVTTAPTVDGDTTDWAGIAWVEDIPLANNRMVSMKAAVTTTDIYFLFQWADSTLSMTRGGSWSYDGANWTKSAGQSEDRIALLWNISIPEADWDERGCMNKCHRDVDNTNAGNDTTTSEDDAFLPAGQKADMWHMKAARSLGAISASQTGPLTIDPATHEVTAGKVTLNGYIDDKYVGEYTGPPDGGRHGDAGTETYSHNRNDAKTAPKYIETDPTDYIDAMVLTQTEIDNGEAVLVADATANDLATYWAKYAGFNAVVPERILSAPTGSRADVLQSATWENGVWYTEIKRPLNTGNDDDAQFTVGSFKFGIALMDNAGGDEHWTTGSVLNTLNIPSITGVDSRDIAGIPREYALYQNYPNPFNPTTNIEFDVVKQGKVTLKVFNILGEEVATVVDKIMAAGRQRVTFDGANLASGVYFYRIEVNEFVATKKLLLLK